MIKVEFQIKDKLFFFFFKLLTNSVKTIDSHLEKKNYVETLSHSIYKY